MKKVFAIMVLLVIVLCSAMAVQADAAPTLNGKVFFAFLDNSIVATYFQQGPFGPGEGGTCSIYSNGVEITDVSYTFDGINIAKLTGVGEFLLEDTTLTSFTRGLVLTDIAAYIPVEEEQ